MDFGIIATTLQTVAKFLNFAKTAGNYSSDNSLPEATKLTRVEPLTIISKDLLNLEYMPDVANSLLSLFCAYYLQAVAVLTRINDVEVIRILDRLNPDRDHTALLLNDKVATEAMTTKTFSLESAKYALPTVRRIATEDEDSDNIKAIAELTNLSVGKLLNVNISYNKDGDVDKDKVKSVNIPVSVRLISSVIPINTIMHLLTYKSDDTSLGERFHAWRAGRISFFSDLIFCQDLIDEFKRAGINDESDTLVEIVRRTNNAKKYGLLTKNPSLVAASNIFVISEEVAREIESKLGGKLSNEKIRQKAFENTYAMIIVVVDREWERVTFYTRGVSRGSDLSIKEIKTANKGKGPDIADLLKAMTQGMPPQF